MTPFSSLHNPIFHRYLIIVSALLGVAGVVLVVLGKALRKDVSSIWLTYRSWLVMIPLIALAVLIGRWGVIVGGALLSLAGFKEFARATHLDDDRSMTTAVCVLILAVTATSLSARFE